MNKKIIINSTVTSLLVSSLPFYQIEAKNVSDVWNFEKLNVAGNFYSNPTSHVNVNYSVEFYNRAVIPQYFNVPKTRNNNNPIRHFGPNLIGKGIQYVSFIDTNELSDIGMSFHWKNAYAEGQNYYHTFRDNEIRKIYWNASNTYIRNITMHPYVFADNKIQNLDMPTRVVTIYEGVFYNNEIVWINGWDNVSTISKKAFENNKLVSFLPNGYKFELPKNINVINEYTFKNNLLTYVEIPENILTIKEEAFANNPMTGIYFKNPNALIDEKVLGDMDYSKLTVYGSGEKSTAKTYAAIVGAKYVNVNEYEWYVFEAEESKTKEKLDYAYEKINAMEASDLKDSYLKRLDQLNKSFEVESSVLKAEASLTDIDYKSAVQKVKTLDVGTVRTTYEKRLELVLKAINNAKMVSLSDILSKIDNNLTLSELDKHKEFLQSLPQDLDTINLLNQLEQKRSDAGSNSYKQALSYLEYTKKYKNLKNVLETQKLINELPDGYKFTTPLELTYTEQYLLDSNGNKIIDEELSYKIDTDGNFETDLDGNKILKDGLMDVIYVEDPNYGKTYTINEEKGSKEYLQKELSKFDDLVYALSAVEIAEKYANEEKAKDALLLTFVLEDGPEKEELLKRINKIEDEIASLSDRKKEVEELIEEYKKNKKQSSYDEIETYIKNNFSNAELKKEYLNSIKQTKYIIESEKIISDAEKKGLTEETVIELLSKISLIDSNADNYDSIINKSTNLINEFENYSVTYLELMKKIDSNKELVGTITLEDYRNLQFEIMQVKENNTYKTELETELLSLYKLINENKEGIYKYELLKEEIDFNKTNIEKVSIEELQILKEEIKNIENKQQRQELTKELDVLIEKILNDHLLKEIEKEKDVTLEKKEYILEYVTLLSDASKKEKIKKKIDDKIYNIVLDSININLTGPEVINNSTSKNIDNLKDILKLIEDENIQNDLITLIDDKVINVIKETEKEINENINKGTGKVSDVANYDTMIMLGKLYSMIDDLSKKETVDNSVKNIVNEYFTESYPNYNIAGDYTVNDYKDMSNLINNFDGIHFNDISQDQIENNIDSSLIKEINQKFDDNRVWDAGTLNQTIEDIGSIVNQNVKAEMINNLNTHFNEQLNNIDLSKKNSLSTLTDLGDTIKKVYEDNSIGGNLTLQEGLKSYLTDNAQTIYDIAKQNNNEQSYIQFLSDYLSEDTINKLIQNDNDNVVGKQNNDNKYYQDTINNLQGDIEYLRKALENLEEIISKLNGNGNQMLDSSINTIGNNQGGFSFSNGYGGVANNTAELILKEMGINESFETNNNLINELKEQIIELQKENQELFLENTISLKASEIENDEKINGQIEAYKEGNKSFNNLLIIMGSSMWILILLGLAYLANLNLRNKKIIEKMSKENKDLIIENERKNEEFRNEIIEQNKEIKELLNQIKDKK